MRAASHRTFLLLALLGTVAAVPAFAQSSPQASPQAGAQTGSPSGSGPALSTYPACTNKPSQPDTEAAHGAYMAGKGSFDEADYTTALNYFKDAYRRDCTKHELLIIIARAYELKGDKREAVHALETYLERVPNAQDAEVQKRRIANLKREIADAPPLVAPPSSASAAPAPSSSAAPSASATAAPSASTASTSMATAPAESPSRQHSVTPWILVGAGGLAIVAGAILLPVGAGKVSDAERVCPVHSQCKDSGAMSTGNTGRTMEMLGWVGLGVGAAALATGLVWHFLEPSGSATTQTGKPQITPRITPQLAPGYAGMSLGAKF